MAEFAVELHHLTKIFSARDRSVRRSDVPAVMDINLQVRTGEFFTILGPSGCGKTTTLRLIAGFEKPSSGEIYIGGQPVAHIPPNRRPVNTVFQNYALFPHLNVVQNVGYGLTVKRVPRPEREQRVAEVLALVRMGGMEGRKPAELSGGQQQRVALARALVNQPAVLLLDEPLGALDLKLRKEMQDELKQLQAKVGITFVYITHDQEEALTMSDRIAVMQDGRVLQVDEPLEIYEKPRTRFVADFIGETNFLRCQVGPARSGQVEVAFAGEVFTLPAAPLVLSKREPGQGFIAVRPEKLVLAAPGEIGLSRNGSVPIAFPAVVDQATFLGTDIRYLVRLQSDERVAVRVQNTHLHTPGEFTAGSPVRVWCYPDDLGFFEAPSLAE